MNKESKFKHILATGLCSLFLLSLLAISTAHQHQPDGHQQQRQTGNADQHATADSGKITSTMGSTNTQRPARHLVEKTFIDLSHPLHNGTLHWPKNSGFQYSVIVDGERKNQRDEPYHVKSDNFTTAVHTGTHIDAPVHFSKTGWTIDQIPLDRLINVPVSVIDVSEKVNQNRSYNFVKEDFFDSKTKESLVQPKSVVLVYTGISKRYDQGEKAYLGTDTKKISDMQIPGFSQEAAEYMVERGVYGVGLDAPSADSSDRHGANETMDPVAHVILNSKNIYILENINSKLEELLHQPAGTARLTIAPLPIVGGSGSPVRLVATTGHEDCHCFAQNSAHNFAATSLCASILVVSLSLILLANRRF